MTWRIEDTGLDTYFKCVQAVNNNAVLRVEDGHIYCRALSTCGTVYGTFDYQCKATGNGITALNIERIVSVIDKNPIVLDFADNTLVMIKGRSRFKTVELANNVVKEPGVLTVDTPNVVKNVKIADLNNALKEVSDFYSTETFVPSIRFILGKGLTIKELDGNVEIPVDGEASGECEVIVNFELLQPLLSAMKSIPTVDIYARDEETPLVMKCSDTRFKIVVCIAPRVVK